MKQVEFKAIGIEDRAHITAYTTQLGAQICDLAFANLYGWSSKYQTSWAQIEGVLVIRFRPSGSAHYAYLIPLCDNPEQVGRIIRQLGELASAQGHPLELMGVTPKCRIHLENLCVGAFDFISGDGSKDYIYLRERMANLSGKKLQSKRNHINKFEKLYPNYTYEPISRENLAECLAIEEQWLQTNGAEDGRSDEADMIQRLAAHYEELELKGGAIRVDGRIVAFTIGSPINQDTYGIHVEKALTEYEGSFTIINREFARRIPEQYTYINREEDLGLEGLRRSKLSYDPELILDKDIAVLKR